MSNTTQILFNSPALHSLKRDQLVKLCKIHSIKASGKNVDLIEKLKQHALTLQSAQQEEANDAMEGVEVENTVRSEVGAAPSDANNSNNRQMPRPSEQWEVVMDSIEETDEGSGSSQNTVSSKGTLRTLATGSSGTIAGEFGTSSKSSVSSSIKALATSLGLNRVKGGSSKSIASLAASNSMETSFASVPSSLPSLSNVMKKRLDTDEELIAASVPYSSIPESTEPPQNDHLTFVPPSRFPGGFGDDMDTDAVMEDSAPLPGHRLRPGLPAPAAPDVRMSLGLNTPSKGAGPATTIRLVSGSNVNGSSGETKKEGGASSGWNNTTWSGGDTPKLKPFATSFDLVLSPGPIYPSLPLDDLMAAKNPATPTKAGSSKSCLSPPRPAPFVFGSPLPQHRLSNAQFQDAAKNVLEEMNKRLLDDGVQGVSSDVLKGLDPSRRVDLSAAIKAASPSSKAQTQEAERVKVRQKFERAHEEAFEKMAGINEPIGVGKKRKSNVLMERSDRRASAGVRKRSSVGVGIRQGGIGVHRTSGVRVISGGRRKAANMLPGGFGDDDGSESDEEDKLAQNDDRESKRVRVEEEEAAQKAQEADEARKLKEEEILRRKLARNKAARRSSIAAARQSMGRGRASIGRNAAAQPKPKPSRFGFLSSAKNLVTGMWKSKPAAAPSVPKNTSIPIPTKSAVAPVPPPSKSVKADSSRKASGSINAAKESSSLLKPQAADKSSTVKSNSSGRSRSPIPSFGATADSSGTQRTSSRPSSIAKGSNNRERSMGTRPSTLGTAVGVQGTSRVSSMGIKSGRASTMTDSTSNDSKISKTSLPRPTPRPSATSRLMAPTASSLAKIHVRGSSIGLDVAKEKENNPRSPGGLATTPSPRPGVFNKHFSPSPTGIPSPIKPSGYSSFGQAVATIAGSSTKEVSELAPKPRSLNGRKPRISRSKVIAKLASQRSASGSSGKTLRPSLDAGRAGRTRSSLGAKVHRESLGAGLKSGKGEAILMAKRKARASEYARRKSLKEPGQMNVDD